MSTKTLATIAKQNCSRPQNWSYPLFLLVSSFSGEEWLTAISFLRFHLILSFYSGIRTYNSSNPPWKGRHRCLYLNCTLLLTVSAFVVLVDIDCLLCFTTSFFFMLNAWSGVLYHNNILSGYSSVCVSLMYIQ